MNTKRSFKVDVTTSVEDWEIIRDCYAKGFFNYPLYKYIVPDKSKREEFIKAYLDANYEVTVQSGQGVVVGMWVPEDTLDDNGNSDDRIETPSNKLIGGVLMVPPSHKGSGWAVDNDEPYWKAYEKHNLATISKEGLERVKKYEAWENAVVAQKATHTRIPMWNGLFCAMLPEYSSRGLGSIAYKQGLKVVARQWLKRMKSMTIRNSSSNSMETAKYSNRYEEHLEVTKRMEDLSVKQSHVCNQINSKPIIPHLSNSTKPLNYQNNAQKILHLVDEISSILPNPKLSLPSLPPQADLVEISNPFVVAISHCERSANFHKSNGFEPILKIPFHDKKEDSTPFFVHILALDPKHSGSTNQLYEALTMQ